MQRQALKVKQDLTVQNKVTGNIEMREFADKIRAMKFVLANVKTPAPALLAKEYDACSRATD